MRFDLRTLDPRQANRLMTSLVTPRPIAWVSTVDASGRVNAAPFSFFNVMSSWPPVVAIGLQPRPDGEGLKDTRRNIDDTGEFVVNFVDESVSEDMVSTSAPYPPGVDELGMLGLATAPSEAVRPPRIAAAPAALECRLRVVVPLEHARSIIIGDILVAHVKDSAVVDEAAVQVDARALALVSRLDGAGAYGRPPERFQISRPAGASDYRPT